MTTPDAEPEELALAVTFRNLHIDRYRTRLTQPVDRHAQRRWSYLPNVVLSIDPESLLMADTVEKVRAPAEIGLFGSIWRRCQQLTH